MKKFSLALVTGASSGIGESLCHLLAAKGISLLITGRDKAKLEQMVATLQDQVKIISFPADLTIPAERNKVIEMIHEYCPDLVINNAGMGLYGDALTHSTEQQMAILTVNGEAVLEITLEAARMMKSQQKQGVILNVSSSAAFQIFPQFAVYAATKAFVNSFTESFDQEMQAYGIRVLTACPGMVKTAFSRRAGGSVTTLDKALAMTPEFAAQEIWQQIQKGKAMHLFDWKYRFLTYLSSILPKQLKIAILRRSIANKIKNRFIFFS